ncbi:hypothetical protein F4813DRAFT_192513 [Daldinia decipiens]|uniref:uncharacterized protein n=1 Tax=Daldinia decipiens TaxID=326647 RepID=UPI0020C31C24|nr:uncharacterized protein F4813DRAFT_192513 [Daldinia decipiens]KAI1654951.1 hypothetical protein F4813DRAFT_192513 [Daldinia decipiens]
MSMTRIDIGDVEDIRSRKVVTIEPDSSARVGSLANDWMRDPSWFWPPPLYQAYCKLHFLKECSLYHLWENECFKLQVETNTLKTKKASKWPTAPTRVQPSRRAREKSLKDQPGVSASRQSSPSRNSKADGTPNTLDTRREQLRLHLPWPVYKTQLEGRIKHAFDTLRGNKQEDIDISKPHSTSDAEPRLECRYCRFDPVVIDCEDSVPRRLAPPAPMYFILPDDISEEQIGEFGGIKFAVGLSDNHEAIILLGIDKLDDLVG